MSSQPHTTPVSLLAASANEAVQLFEDRLEDVESLLEEMKKQLLQLKRNLPTSEQWEKCKKVLDTTLSHCRDRIKQTTNRPEWLGTKLDGVFNLFDDIEHILYGADTRRNTN